MTRKEFLQFAGGALAVILGLSNLLSLFGYKKSEEISKEASGFGTRKFGA